MKQKVLDQYQSSPHPVHDETKSFGSTPPPHPLDATTKNFEWQSRPVARLFCGGGGQIDQILGPFMITGGLSCNRVEFGHFEGGGVR